ncbi:hypothetical protein A1I_05270 [Rickettsia bellii OSU 85-389]|uniref:DUF2670 domain-containing protein n=1 Tax=Rickettsia bellii TaxID=33990 RepID=UPI0000DB0FAA|nr:DUF2670 domain-containing protein [Rickettsia bellii]ABV79381.1 hypothetical protein A1I_05270 [Rickettsia bellii OSU 85-389]
MWQALRRLIAANPMGVFLWGIISKWYIMIAVASLIVLFYAVKGLEKIGFIDYFGRTTVEILDTSKAIAQNCTVKLGPNWDNLVNFWNCLGDPGKYEVKEGTGEQELQQGVERLINKPEDGGEGDGTVPEPRYPIVNPYDNGNNTNTN